MRSLPHPSSHTPSRRAGLRRAMSLTALALMLSACGGGGSGSDGDGSQGSITISPFAARVQGNWSSCSTTTNSSGVANGSQQDVLGFSVSPLSGRIGLVVQTTRFASSDCSGTPSGTTVGLSVDVEDKDTALLPGGEIVERVIISGPPGPFGGKQVISLGSSSRMRLGDPLGILDSDGFPRILSPREFLKL
jgi:hypothetical protein